MIFTYLIYDGSCTFCTKAAMRLTKNSPVRPLPSNILSEAYKRSLGLSADDLKQYVWFIKGKQKARGAEAVARTLLEKKGLSHALGICLLSPPMPFFTQHLYALVAKNRKKISVFFKNQTP